jgi:membrane protein required for colicin V production
MAPLDWVFLAVLAGSLLLGAWRGLVYEVLSVLGWIAAFVVAQWLAGDVAQKLPMGNASEAVRYAAAFAVVFIATVFAAGLVAWLTKKLVESVGLRPADRALGAVFGVVRGLILLLAVTVVVNLTPLRTSAWWQDGVGSALATTALKGLKPALPVDLARYLP